MAAKKAKAAAKTKAQAKARSKGSGKQKAGPRPAGDPVFSRLRFGSFAHVMATAPVVSAAMGAVAGFPAARLAASHFSIMTKETSQVLIAGPALVERAFGIEMTKDELGGAKVHAKSGVVDCVANDEAHVFELMRQFLSYLPSNVWQLAPRQSAGGPGAWSNGSSNWA